MNCPNCGTANLDNATICVNCGRALTPAAASPAPAAPTGPTIPNYLVQSILVTLCCCLPLGIVALIFSTQVNSKLAAGDVAGAMEASRKAKMWCWLAVGIGIAAMILWMVLGGAAVLQGYREGLNG